MIIRGLRQIRFLLANAAKNPYKVLGLNQNATQEQIKNAYYKLAKQYHPDIRPQYSQTFKQINQAYNILKDPSKRAAYENPSSYNQQNNEQEQYHRQSRSSGYSNADRNAYYEEMLNRMNREYEQDYRRDPSSMKREQMRQMRRQYYRNLFWQQHFYGSRYASPFQLFFMAGLLFTLFVIMASLYFNLYQYDQMRRKAYTYDYVPYPYQQEDDEFY